MWNSEELVTATTGRLQGPAFAVTGVAIDSRKVTGGTLFLALKGERVDGHDYVKTALEAGAAGALVHRIPEGMAPDAPLILVNDTYKALVDLAFFSRRRTRATLIAVTGSVGKTGTKEAIRTALSGTKSVYATEGNLNNHIGLPLSLANLAPDMRFGVFELGMNHAGELAFLTRILRPDIAVITNVEAVHLEFFENVEAIADAKAEIMQGLTEKGTVILNRDNAHYARLEQKAREQGITNQVTFGAHAEAQCRLAHYAVEEMGSRVEAVVHGTWVTYHLGTLGRHWAITSLAALAAVVVAGADLPDAAAALAQFQEPDGRGKLRRIAHGTGFITLIDDCYNASPSSTAAAIAKLAEIKNMPGLKGRAVAVLGDMLELGATSAQLHKDLMEPLMRHGIDKVYLAGPMMKHLHAALPQDIRAAHAASAAALAACVTAELADGDIVLIKGSRGSRMDIVRDALIASSSRPMKESAHAL